MEYLTIPEVPVLRGERAKKALYKFIDELGEREGKEFTDKQAAALHKFAKALLVSLDAEAGSDIRKSQSKRGA